MVAINQRHIRYTDAALTGLVICVADAVFLAKHVCRTRKHRLRSVQHTDILLPWSKTVIGCLKFAIFLFFCIPAHWCGRNFWSGRSPTLSAVRLNWF